MNRIQWIGVDIAKRSFVAAKPFGKGFRTQSFALTAEGVQAFHKWLPRKPQLQIVVESTGPYWRAFTWELEKWAPALPVAVVNPRRVRDFAKASPQASKTDPLDAQLLIFFAETFDPPLCQRESSSPHHRLRAMCRHALQLRQQLDLVRDQQEKAAVDPYTPKEVLLSLQQLQDHLQQALKHCWVQARQLVRQDSGLQQTFRLLLSIPGLGEKTVLTLLSEYGLGLSQANPKQLTRYAGLDVILFESGESVRRRPRISKQGNWRIRRALFMAALVAIRHNPIVCTYYRRLVNRGLAKMSALVASMRKLLHLCYGVLRSQSPFDPAFS